MRKRNHTVTIRMNKAEYELLQSKIKESGRTQQEVVIKAIADLKIASTEEVEELKRLNQMFADILSQLRGATTNINQIARKLHTDGEIPNDSMLYFLNKNILKYRKESEKIWLLIRRLISGQIHSNLSKTFHLDISKEALEHEFNGNYERIRAEAERTAGADEELIGYYRQVEAACEGTGRNTGESDGREGRVTGEKSEDERVYPGISEKNTQSENGKTEAILRESRNARRNAEVECRNSADDRRIVRNAETQSVFTAEQRRLEEQKRLDEKERARAARKRNKRRSGPEL